MSLIVPAILEQAFEGFEDKVFKLEHLVGLERIQVDFCDGQFVDNATLRPKDLDVLNPAFVWEAHVMAREPVQFLEYSMVGFRKVIVHVEAFAEASDIERALFEIQNLGMVPALALNPETDPARLLPFATLVREFTVMTVHPGRQGALFLPERLEAVRFLRKQLPDAILEVDGGVNVRNIAEVIASGADMAAAGSALFHDGTLQENFDLLMTAGEKI